MRITLEFFAFWSGWLAKGLVAGLVSQLVFQPLVKVIIKRAEQSEKHFIAGYIFHHLQQHPEIKYSLCQLCQTP